MMLLLFIVAFVNADVWDRWEGAGYALGSSGWENPDGPGPVLQSACAREENAGYKWEAQMEELASKGHTTHTAKKRSISAWEMFRGDQSAYNHFLRQFHHDSVGRKRAVKMERYHEKTVDGSLIQDLDNWNEPVNLGLVDAGDTEPKFEVAGGEFTPKAASPSKQVRKESQILVDCKLGEAAEDCDKSAVAGKEFCCVISRGAISFIDKVKNCVAAGGSSALIYNNKVDAPDEELGATLGDERASIPVVTLSYGKGKEIVDNHLGKLATVSVPKPSGSGWWLPLTSHKNQGSCGDCYLYAAMTSVTMWANLLLWEEKAAKGEDFTQEDQFWMDTNAMTQCYQYQLNTDPSPSKATLDVQFSTGRVSGTEDEVKETFAKIMAQMTKSPDSSSKLISTFRAYHLYEVEAGDCGFRCYSLEVSMRTFNYLTDDNGVISTGFEAEVDGETYTIEKVTATKGAKVCGGGWHNVVLDEWYEQQQFVRTGRGSSAVRLQGINSKDDAAVNAEKFAQGPSQKKISADNCQLLADAHESAPLLYRFDPHFDEDEAMKNPPPREDGPLNTYRPLYMPRSSAPGTAQFANKVRSIVSATIYGPAMIGIAVCNSMFSVGTSNSVSNPYFDLECKDSINHIVNVIGFHIEDLPAEGQGTSKQVDGKEWWERSSLLVQNTWGSWGNLGQAWVRVDFTQQWSLGITPLVRSPDSFKNPYLPSKRLEELRLGKRWSRDTEEITGQSLELVEPDAVFTLSRPVLPEVAFKEAVVTLVIASRNNVAAAPTWLPENVIFGALFSEEKYFEDDVTKDVLDRSKIEDTGDVIQDGNWVLWQARDVPMQWSKTTLDTRSGEISTYEIEIRIQLAATELSTTKPATFWQRLELEIGGGDPGLPSGQSVVMRDFYLVIDEDTSAEFRNDDKTSAHSITVAALATLTAFVALF